MAGTSTTRCESGRRCRRWRPPPRRWSASAPCGRAPADGPVAPRHRDRVAGMIADAAAAHAALVSALPPELGASLPVDAQGITQAIDHLAAAAGLSEAERRGLIRAHAVNPAVLHARVFGAAPLPRETVIGAFVEGARVRADALTALAEAIGDEPLGREVRALL